MKTILISIWFFYGMAWALAAPPNIVIFYLDDMAWAQPSCYGGKLAPTPNIDSLAAQGIRFTQGYSSGCVCSPGRAGLLTGRYQARTGHDANPGKDGEDLPLSETTMAQRLKAIGYTTAIVGKWHLGVSSPEFLPAARGFDFAMGTTGNLGEGKGPAFYRGMEFLPELEGAPVTSPVYAREACQWVEGSRDKPFFLLLSFNAVHAPNVASPKWLEKFATLPKRECAYAAMIAEADECIGTVMNKLRDLNLEENTLVFCLSDNGGSNGAGEQLGLRGRKWTVWEGGTRISWIAQWKGRIPGGQVSSEPVMQIDILPTALAAAGVEAAKDWQLDGVNLLPFLERKAERVARPALYWRFGVQYAVRQGDWKLVKAGRDLPPLLCNLASDPGEQIDLTSQHPEKAKELQSLWDDWNATMQPPRWQDKRWNGEEFRQARKSK
jgi:arylsulfatase A-like enzyme